MRKEELKKLKRIYATSLMMRLAKQNKLDKPIQYKSEWETSYTEKKTKYDMFIRCQTRGKILMVAIFFPKDMEKGIKEPLYEIYCNAEGYEFITRINRPGKKEKWSTAKMKNLGRVCNETWICNQLTYGYKNADSRIWQNQEGKTTIKRFLGTDDRGWKGIVKWQEKARSEQIKRQEERQQKPWDEDMALIPEILPGFKRWTKHEATDENFIFYHYEKSGAKMGYCSYCEKQVPISNPKHNNKTVCPCCKKNVIFKADSRIKTLYRKEYRTECIQKIDGGIVIRQFRTYSHYRGTTPDKPKITMYEEERHLVFDNGQSKSYYYGSYKNKKLRWIPNENNYYRRGYGYSGIKLYGRNLATLRKGELKNSAIDLWESLPISTSRYLYVEKSNPVIEKLARIGMFKLAEDIIKAPYDVRLLNQNETELAKMLKIDKARLKRLKEMKATLNMLRWMQYEKFVNTIWPDEMIKDFGNAGFQTSGAFGFLPPPYHYVKIWNYLKKQASLSGESIYWVKRTWEDYINMADRAKWNTKAEQIQKPKNLKDAHGKVILFLQKGTMEKQAKELDKKWPKVNGILPKLKKFEYTSGEFQIIAPTSIFDIVIEGTALSHCVHTCDFYFDRIQRNESYLFFLRKTKEPDTPWYTLEVEPSGNIRQKRTTGDNQNEDFKQAISFLKEWQKVFKSRLTKEEIKLGIIADQVRKKEYKKLREEKKTVWHGKLAGKLLADVLEADFMEVV